MYFRLFLSEKIRTYTYNDDNNNNIELQNQGKKDEALSAFHYLIYIQTNEQITLDYHCVIETKF